MNADIIFIEGAGSVAQNAAITSVKNALAKRGLGVNIPLAATAENLTDTFNAALARSNVIAIVGGIGADSADTAMKTVAEVLNEECEMNFSALGRIASSYARSGEDMPESAANAALVIRGATVLPNTVGAATGCAVNLGSQYILLLPGNTDEVNAMLGAAAGSYLDTAVGALAAESGEELEFSCEESVEVIGETPKITFNPDAITVDDVQTENEPVIVEPETDDESDVGDDNLVIEPAAVTEFPVAIETNYEPAAEAEEDFSATVVFDAEPEPSAEASAETEPQPEPEGYVVLTPSKDNKTAAEADGVDLKTAAEEPEESEKKPNVFVRIVRFFIPWKGDGVVDILRKVLFFAAIIGLVLSSIYIGDFFIKMADNNQVVEQLREMYHPENTEKNPETGIYNRFDELLEQNPDCVGWITVPNTKIDNPVYKTTDNDYYLTINSLREPSVYGAIFADYRDGITVRGNSKNITLYGHHMKDGSMFANLHNYKKMSFYKENPVVTFDTIYGTGGQYKVFACVITNSDAMDDNGYFFDFAAPNFRSDVDFMNWVEQVRRRSLYNTPVDVVATDEILTLSTCTYEIKESNLLCVVFARKVRDGETAAVNTINTSANSQIIYPAIWYETFGGAKPAFADGLYTWVSGDYDRENINKPTDTSSLPGDASSETPSDVSSETPSEIPSETPSETPNESSEPPVSSEPEPSEPESSEPESSEPEPSEPEPSEPEPSEPEPSEPEPSEPEPNEPDESTEPTGGE